MFVRTTLHDRRLAPLRQYVQKMCIIAGTRPPATLQESVQPSQLPVLDFVRCSSNRLDPIRPTCTKECLSKAVLIANATQPAHLAALMLLSQSSVIQHNVVARPSPRIANS